ncbi:hypothetical protein DL98DRAFT_522392 [Cadophora sp. DSE1049]|nr:hypothetical protein DL98DRAFT_522392 [Cadophora sp. DSE1049]
MAKKSPRGWEPKLLKAKYPWLKDNILKLLITLFDFLRKYSSQCEAAQKRPSIDNLLLYHIWLTPELISRTFASALTAPNTKSIGSTRLNTVERAGPYGKERF